MKLYIIENVKNMYFEEKNHGISVCNNTVVAVLCGNPWGQASVPTHQRNCGSGLKKIS